MQKKNILIWKRQAIELNEVFKNKVEFSNNMARNFNVLQNNQDKVNFP